MRYLRAFFISFFMCLMGMGALAGWLFVVAWTAQTFGIWALIIHAAIALAFVLTPMVLED